MSSLSSSSSTCRGRCTASIDVLVGVLLAAVVVMDLVFDRLALDDTEHAGVLRQRAYYETTEESHVRFVIVAAIVVQVRALFSRWRRAPHARSTRATLLVWTAVGVIETTWLAPARDALRDTSRDDIAALRVAGRSVAAAHALLLALLVGWLAFVQLVACRAGECSLHVVCGESTIDSGVIKKNNDNNSNNNNNLSPRVPSAASIDNMVVERLIQKRRAGAARRRTPTTTPSTTPTTPTTTPSTTTTTTTTTTTASSPPTSPVVATPTAAAVPSPTRRRVPSASSASMMPPRAARTRSPARGRR